MPEQYSLVVTEKFRKGTNVRVITSGTQQQVEQKRSEVKWVSKRGEPHVMKTSEVESFIGSKRTGIFKPTYTPPTPEEVKVKATKKKEQEAFEREKEMVSKPRDVKKETKQEYKERVELGGALRYSKYGIVSKQPTEEVMTEKQLEELKAEASEERQEETFLRQEQQQVFQERVDVLTPKLKFDTAEQARDAGYEVVEEIIPTTRTEYSQSLQEKIKEKGGLKGIEIVAPQGLKGTYAIIPEGSTKPTFTPPQFKLLGTGEMKTGGALAAHRVTQSFERMWKKGKGRLEDIYKPESKMVKKDIRTLRQKMPEWFPGLKEMRKEATLERTKLEGDILKAKEQKDIYGLRRSEARYNIYGFMKGASKAVEKEPEKILALGATFTVLPPVLAGASKLVKASKIGKVIPIISKASQRAVQTSSTYLPPGIVPTAKTISKVVPPKVYAFPGAATKTVAYGSLPAIYGAGVYADVKYADEPSVKFGEIFAGEIAPMGIGGAAGMGVVKKTRKAAVARKQVDIELKTAADIIVEDLPSGKTAILKPIGYTAKVGGRKYVGVGEGRVDITQMDRKYITKGIFNYKVEDVTMPSNPQSFTAVTGTRGAYIQTDYGFKGVSLLATETKVGGRITPSKSITMTRGVQVMGGEYPVTVLKTGVFKPTYPITPKEVRFGITKKFAEKIEPRIYRHEVKYTPEEYGELLVGRGELKGIYEVKLGRERSWGMYRYPLPGYEKKLKPMILIDPRLPKTELQAIYQHLFKKRIGGIKTGYSIGELLQAHTLTRERVLRHELIHHLHKITRGGEGVWSKQEILARKFEKELRGKPFKEIEIKEVPTKTEYFKYWEKGMGAEKYIKQYEDVMQPYSMESFMKNIEIKRLLRGKKGHVLVGGTKVKPGGEMKVDVTGTVIKDFKSSVTESIRKSEISRLPRVKRGVYSSTSEIMKRKLTPTTTQSMKPIAKEKSRVQPIMDINIESRLRTRQPVDIAGKQVVAQKQKLRMRPALEQVYKLGGQGTPTPFVPGPPPPPPPPAIIPPLPFRGKIKPYSKPKGYKGKRKYRGTPSLSNILYGGGSQLSRGQITGKEFISPLMIRKMGRQI